MMFAWRSSEGSMLLFKKKFLFIGLLIVSFTANAETHINRKTAILCAQASSTIETKLNLPNGILKAISLKETGRWDNLKKESVAWPWTVTAKGKGTYHQTKLEALRAVRNLQNQGIKNIDVGCMQINLYYHPHAFKKLDEAFNPKLNTAYAGEFLNQLFEDHGSWQQAIERYHSSDQKRGKLYRLAIEKLQLLDFKISKPSSQQKNSSVRITRQKQLKQNISQGRLERHKDTNLFRTHQIEQNKKIQQAFIQRKARVLARWKKMMQKREKKNAVRNKRKKVNIYF
jgi:hypothetical protein